MAKVIVPTRLEEKNPLLTVSATDGLFKPTPALSIIDSFIDSQDVMPNSKKLYRRTLSRWFSWAQENALSLHDITRADIIGYKEQLISRGVSALTVCNYLTVVRRFFDWAESSQLGLVNVARGIKNPRRKQEFKKLALTSEQTTKLLEHFKNQPEGLRNYAIINLLVRTGLRTIEAMNAEIKDIIFKQNKRVLMVQGKGRMDKSDFVILTDKCYEPIRAYLAMRPSAKASEPLFTSVSNNSQGKRLTTRTLSKVAKEGLKAVGLDSKYLTAHSLRHTLAVSILKAGGSLTDAQSVLRHSNPATTQIYTHSIEEELRIKNAPEELIENVY